MQLDSKETLCSAMKFLLGLYTVLYIITRPSTVQSKEQRYQPHWPDLDKRPLPQWYDKAKIGIFIHWGVYSVPSYGSEWFWYRWKSGKDGIPEFMKQNYPTEFKYQDFASQFTAEFFNPKEWAEMFANSGARYVVLTAKHHEGFTLFPSRKAPQWNSVFIGPHRDIVSDLSKAVRLNNMTFGIYYSLIDWYSPDYELDKKKSFHTHLFPQRTIWPEIEQLILDYKPSILWSDGHWDAHEKYWNSTNMIAWLYNDSPVKDEIVVNDRWGKHTECKHGDFHTCGDKFNPGVLMSHKWENCFTLDKHSWGYRRNMNIGDVLTFQNLLKEVVSTVSCGGNVLLNVGPTKEGTIPPIFQLRLLELGKWLKINGEAIYDTSPWLHQNDSFTPNVWYTCKKKFYNVYSPTARPSQNDRVTTIYAIGLKWPTNNTLILRDLTSSLPDKRSRITLLGGGKSKLKWLKQRLNTVIHMPRTTARQAFALKITPPPL